MPTGSPRSELRKPGPMFSYETDIRSVADWGDQQSGQVSCGDCVGCVSRRDAFEEVGADDTQVACFG